MSERSLNARTFFISNFLSEAHFGALAGFLGTGFVNVIGANRRQCHRRWQSCFST